MVWNTEFEPGVPTDPKLVTAKSLRVSADRLLAEAKRLEDEAKALAIPPKPDRAFWRVDVKFTQYGSTYTYLLMKHGERWYTTGQDDKTQKFQSWRKLWEWLEGPDVYAHSRLQVLVHLADAEEIGGGIKPVLGIERTGLR